MPNPLNLSLAADVRPNIEHVNAEIVELEELEEMSIVEVNEAKRKLGERKRRLQLQLDDRKLNQATGIMDSMTLILQKMTDNLCSAEPSAADTKFYAEAYNKMLTSLNTISRLDSIDGTGRAAMLSIEVKYKEG